ncbi:MAG: YggS family pyridoxal phosphate-dependent enzyme [Spirochaetes bacterium]|nr:MAG: YggS family pyridoxal phosphate-dependent enzyme [Spirochaetota bacterium]
MSYIEKVHGIREEIDAIAHARGGDARGVQIIAISKTHDADTIQKAINEGIRLFGENRIQEARAKIPLLKGEFGFHLVGHLQSNKARDAVALFELIHSIDKHGTAVMVDTEARKIDKVQKVLVQVNTSGEDSKSGVRPDDAIALCRAVRELPSVDLRGLMTIGPLTGDEDRVRASFRMLAEILTKTNAALGTDMQELSMGMSSDYRIAVEEGATMVRIGTAIFGTRD